MKKVLNAEDFRVGEFYWRRKLGKLNNGELHSAQIVEFEEVSGRKCFQPNRFWLDFSTLKEYEFIGPINNPFKNFSTNEEENMSLHDYLESGGNLCPFCRSDRVEANGEVVIDDLYGLQKVDCVSCGHSWDDKYKLVSFEGR